jgi:hypothetical protein
LPRGVVRRAGESTIVFMGESVAIRGSGKERKAGNMPGMAKPLAADKLDAWEA